MCDLTINIRSLKELLVAGLYIYDRDLARRYERANEQCVIER